MNICRLNRSSKVCMKKGPARHTCTPPSSLPEPKIILIILSNRDSVPEPIFLGSPRRSPQSKVFYNRPLLVGPAFIKSHSAIARWFLRSAAIRGESDDTGL